MRLRFLREKKHITQQRLAIDLDMNQNTVSRYESGKRQADYETLIRVPGIGVTYAKRILEARRYCTMPRLTQKRTGGKAITTTTSSTSTSPSQPGRK